MRSLSEMRLQALPIFQRLNFPKYFHRLTNCPQHVDNMSHISFTTPYAPTRILSRNKIMYRCRQVTTTCQQFSFISTSEHIERAYWEYARSMIMTMEVHPSKTNSKSDIMNKSLSTPNEPNYILHKPDLG